MLTQSGHFLLPGRQENLVSKERRSVESVAREDADCKREHIEYASNSKLSLQLKST